MVFINVLEGSTRFSVTKPEHTVLFLDPSVFSCFHSMTAHLVTHVNANCEKACFVKTVHSPSQFEYEI